MLEPTLNGDPQLKFIQNPRIIFPELQARLKILVKFAPRENKPLYDTHRFKLWITGLLIGDDRCEHWRFSWLLYSYYCVTVHVITVFRKNCSRQYVWLKHQSDWPFAASNNCLKRGQKAPSIKAQGTRGSQFDCPMAVSQNIDVYNIKYKIMLNKN